MPLSREDGKTFERDVWGSAHQYPLNPGSNRLVVIRDAEKLNRWDQLETWLSRTRKLPGVYLVFVSNEKTLPHVGGKQGTLAPHAKMIRAPRGSLVKCTLPKEEDAVAWVRRRAAMLDESTAKYLLTRTGGDLDTAAAVCAKISLFSGPAGTATIDQLCTERPAADFSDSLLAGHKKHALRCIPDLGEGDLPRLLALLDSRLDMLQHLHRVQLAGQSWRDAVGVNPYLVRQYMPLARDYDPSRCVYRRRVLAVVDDALRSGARVGVFEALVALW